jgi:capsular exopolysaccharide synthesis family protein
MSQFFKALQQAERDRALREQNGREPNGGRAHATDDAPRAAVVEVTEPRRPARVETVAPPGAAHVDVAESPAPSPFATPPRPRPELARRREPPVGLPAAVVDGVVPDAHLVSLLQPAAFEAEQYRVLRHMVEQRRTTSQLTVIGVTSAGPGEGKTLTSLNLAGALAQNPGARVLVIELDLRKPAVDHRLGLPDAGERGLTRSILMPHVRLSDIVRRHPHFNLSVVSAGHPSASPYELLNSPRLAELIEQARQEADYVVLDCPPVVPFPDCRVIGKLVDGFFIVVAADRTPRGMLEETLNVMGADKVLGLVFNGDRHATSCAYYGYGAYDTTRAYGRDGSGWRRTAERLGAAVGRRRSGRAVPGQERW